MSTGRIEIKHIFPAETDWVVLTIRKTSNLLTLVPATFLGSTETKFAYAAPHPEESMVLTEIDPVMYLVTAYRSVDGTTLNQQLLQLAVDASTNAQYPITIYEYVVNRGSGDATPGSAWQDPSSGTNELRDERLLNKSYRVVERGTSLLLLSEYTDRSDVGGGFDFTTVDKNFEDGGVYFVIVNNPATATTGGGTTSGSSDYNDIVEVSANDTFNSATMANKILVSTYAGANKILLMAMPNLALVPDCKFRMQANGGTQRYFALQLDAGDTVPAYGDDLNVIYIGKGELVEFLVKSNVLYIISPLTGYERLGRRVWGDKQELNTLFRDGTQYNQADVPRLMQFVDTLPGGNVVPEGTMTNQWSFEQIVDGKTVYPNKGLFARDDGAGKIRVPDDRNMFIRAMKYTDATDDTERIIDKPGGYQVDGLKSHNHVGAGTWYGFGGQGIGNLSSNNDAVAQEVANRNQIVAAGGTETRGENIGMLPLIYI